MKKIFRALGLRKGESGVYFLGLSILALLGWLTIALLALAGVRPAGFSAPVFLLVFLVCALAFLASRWATRPHAFLRLILALFVVVVLCYALENLRGWTGWQIYKWRSAARGDRLEMAHYIPPRIPDEENFFATSLWNDMTFYTLPSGMAAANGGSTVVWNNPGWSGRPFFKLGNADSSSSGVSTWSAGTELDLEQWRDRLLNSNRAAISVSYSKAHSLPEEGSAAKDILRALSHLDQDREMLLATISRPKARFWINYEAGYGALLPHLSRLSQASRYLVLHAEAARQSGDKSAAIADTRASFRLVEALRSEPWSISHMVRAKLLRNTIQPIWQGMVHHDWTKADLESFEAELQKLDFLADYDVTLRGERAASLWAADFLEKASPAELADFYQGMGTRTEPGIVEAFLRWLGMNPGPARAKPEHLIRKLMPSGWYDCDRLLLCKAYDAFLSIQTNGTLSPVLTRKAEQVAERQRHAIYSFPLRNIGVAFDGTTLRCANAQAMTDLARVACALERYRLAYTDYPRSLADLQPEFLERVPHDVITGKPLTYRRENEAYVLYSIGWNGVDDGGTAPEKAETLGQQLNEGDWVWRFPGPGKT